MAENGVLWLRDLLPTLAPTARVITYGYNAHTRKVRQLSKYTIFEHAQEFITQISTAREAENVS
jgi:hypothetical protein